MNIGTIGDAFLLLFLYLYLIMRPCDTFVEDVYWVIRKATVMFLFVVAENV